MIPAAVLAPRVRWIDLDAPPSTVTVPYQGSIGLNRVVSAR
jgi:hypothetical protein